MVTKRLQFGQVALIVQFVVMTIFAWVLSVSVSNANPVQVTVSIPPIAGIIAPLLSEEDQINVLLQGNASPHGFRLKPSHYRQLANSDLVVQVGGSSDAWLQKPLLSVQKKAMVWQQLPNVRLLDLRVGHDWDQHNHAHGDHGHHQHGEHQHATIDSHLWLSIVNASVLVEAVSEQLIALKPAQAQQIQSRKQAWLAKLAALDAKVAAMLQPVADVPYIVLHDAFHYFDARYQLSPVGAVRLRADVAPSMKRLYQIKQRIEKRQVKCIFKEPQFPATIVSVLAEELTLSVGELDPLGLAEQQGFLPYDQLLLKLAEGYLTCLSNVTVEGKQNG